MPPHYSALEEAWDFTAEKQQKIRTEEIENKMMYYKTKSEANNNLCWSQQEFILYKKNKNS